MAETHPEKPPVYVILHDPKTAGQYMQIMAEHPRRLIYAEKYNFTGDGKFIDTVGSADGTIGQQVADSVYKVHFGQFGGLPVKLAFGIFGICLLYIITSGLRIYFLKRRNKGRDAPALEGAWKGLIWGAPVLMATSFAASTALPLSAPLLTRIFWIGLILAAVAGAVLAKQREGRAA